LSLLKLEDEHLKQRNTKRSAEHQQVLKLEGNFFGLSPGSKNALAQFECIISPEFLKLQ